MSQTAAPTTLAAFTPAVLAQRYPNLKPWALTALHEIQHSDKTQAGLSPEARAVLNIVILPMPFFIGTKEEMLDAAVDARSLFATQKSYEDNKEHVDLCRLSADVLRVWKD